MDTVPDPNGPQLENRRGSGGTFAAWTVILLAMLLVVVMQAAGPRPEAGDERLAKALFERQAQYLVAASQLLGDQAAEQVLKQFQQTETMPPWQRVRYAILAGELSGPRAALEGLQAADGSASPAADAGDVKITQQTLVRLYEDYAADKRSAPSLSEPQRRRLHSELGWFGDLALAPPGSEKPLRDRAIAAARGTLHAIIGGAICVVLLGLVGLVGLSVLIVFAALLFGGGLAGLDASGGNGGVYAEAFACWLVLFLGASALGAVWLGPEAIVSATLLAFAVSFLAVGWPVFRGVSWQRLRQDLGWTTERGAVREAAAGIGAYTMAIPLVLLAVVVTSVVAGMADGGGASGEMPVHPVAEWLASGTWWQRAGLIVLACVVAPLVEETMFRGFLYRHLREATNSMSRWGTVLVSGLAVSVLFAVLHPQGLVAAPGIAGIGLALAFIREWRGTLLPSMLAHSLNNAVMFGVLAWVLSA